MYQLQINHNNSNEGVMTFKNLLANSFLATIIHPSAGEVIEGTFISDSRFNLMKAVPQRKLCVDKVTEIRKAKGKWGGG